MKLNEYNGTEGPTVGEKIRSIVETRSRKQAAPVADLHGVFCTLNHSHVMDPESDPNLALEEQCEKGELVRIDDLPGRSRPVLAVPTPGVFRYKLGGSPTEEEVTDAIVAEADGQAREKVIGALNQLQDETKDTPKI